MSIDLPIKNSRDLVLGDLKSGTIVRFGLIGICLSITFLSYSYIISYPLSFNNISYIFQTPPEFWVGLLMGIVSLILITYYSRSIPVSLFSVICFFFIFNLREFLYYDLLMADATSISYYSHIVLKYNRVIPPSVAGYFDYLQWPVHFILTIVISQTGGYDLVSSIKAGYFLYIILLGVATFNFTYTYIQSRNNYHLFISSCSFMIAVFPVLNNQYVPQLLSLIYLLFIFSIHEKEGTRWLILKLFLFTILILTHAFIWVFYIGAIILEPAIRSWKATIIDLSGERTSLYLSISKAVRSPVKSTYTLKNNLVKNYSSKIRFWEILVYLCIYASVLSFRFIYFQIEFLYTIIYQDPRKNLSPFDMILRLLPGPMRQYFAGDVIKGNNVAKTKLLYNIVPPEIHHITRILSLSIILLIGVMFLASYLYRNVENIPSFPISISTFAIAYFVLGMVASILGARALQIVLLPLILATKIFERYPITTMILTILLILSPVLIANSMVNQSLNGGEDTGDLHTSVAGKWVHKRSNLDLIQRRGSLRPFIWDKNIHPLDGFVRGKYASQSNGVLIDSPIVRHRIQYLGYQCNFRTRENTVIYDNDAKAIILNHSKGKEYCTQVL